MPEQVIRDGVYYWEYSPHELDEIRLAQLVEYRDRRTKYHLANEKQGNHSTKYKSENYYTNKQKYTPKKFKYEPLTPN